MLEVECSSSVQFRGGLPLPVRPRPAKMPVDFTAYLLSASPPGFEIYNHFSGAPGFGGMGLGSRAFPPPKPIIAKNCRASSAPDLLVESEHSPFDEVSILFIYFIF